MANELGIDPKYQKLFANTLARLTPTILTGGKVDPTKVLMSYMMNQAMKEGKEELKQQVSGAKAISTSYEPEAQPSNMESLSDVDKWINEGSTDEAKIYRAELARKYGLLSPTITDTSELSGKGIVVPDNRSGVGLYAGENMLHDINENANISGYESLKERLGGEIGI